MAGSRINRVSKKNLYYTSDGEAITQGVLNKRIHDAKEQKLAEQREEYGYNFCTECYNKAQEQLLADEPITVKVNECLPVDCAHEISVQECKDNGEVELAYDLNNITPTGRFCHQKKDKLNLQFKRHE